MCTLYFVLYLNFISIHTHTHKAAGCDSYMSPVVNFLKCIVTEVVLFSILLLLRHWHFTRYM